MDRLITITPALDTSAYAIGDVLFDWTPIARATEQDYAGGCSVLQSVHVLDKDDQKVAFDLYLAWSADTLGAVNAAPSISDGNAAEILGAPVQVFTYFDLGGASVAGVDGIGKVVRSLDTPGTLYAAAVTKGTPTHTAAGLVLKLGFI